MSPLTKPDPVVLDLDELRQTLLRQCQPRRVHFFEHGIADNVKSAIVDHFELRKTVTVSPSSPGFAWAQEVALQRFLGQEVFRVWLPGAEYKVAGSRGIAWGEEHTGPIQGWEDLDRYDWPDPKAVAYAELEWYERHLPPEMGVIHVVKVWEVVRELFGFETFCMMLHEESHLIEEVTRRVGEFHLALTRSLCDFRRVFAIYGADDYAFKTATFFAPETIIRLFLGWHERMAQWAHDHGKLFFFHCCGKADSLMDHLIDHVRIDAKHSFEDTVVPVTEAKRRWGHRVALLGGLDVDFVARAGEAAIRQRVRQTLEICQPGGGYCLGMGNWVTSYIPVDSYLVMLDEGRIYGRA
jgi:uroporphyrinogen decarboxylase